MKKIVYFLYVVLLVINTNNLYSQQKPAVKVDTLYYKYGFGPSLLANVTQLKFNGDYEIFSAGFGVGASIKRTNLYDRSYGSTPFEVGLYFSPRFSQDSNGNKGEVALIVHATFFESFGMGLGVNVWKTGQGLVKTHKEDFFFTLGYSLLNESLTTKKPSN